MQNWSFIFITLVYYKYYFIFVWFCSVLCFVVVCCCTLLSVILLLLSSVKPNVKSFDWMEFLIWKKNQNIKRSNDSNINSDSSLMLLLFFMLLVNHSFSEIFICEKLKVPTHYSQHTVLCYIMLCCVLCCAERIPTHSLCLCSLLVWIVIYNFQLDWIIIYIFMMKIFHLNF